jgi:Bacterial regulatory protein, Fis family
MSTRSRRKFTAEFRAEAAEMVESADGNIAQVAKELGIYVSTLGKSPGPPASAPASRADEPGSPWHVTSWHKVYGR